MSNMGRSSADEAREIQDLRKNAMVYYLESGVPERMEEILNSAFYDKPDDIYGHLADYFQGFQKTPTITKVMAREAVDSRGQSTIQTEVYCLIRNKEKLLCTSLCCNESYPHDTVKPEERETAETIRIKDVARTVELINSIMNESLRDLDPTKQEDIDDLLLTKMEELQQADLAAAGKTTPDVTVEQPPSARTPVHETKAKPKSPKGKNKGPPVVIIPDEPREQLVCGCTTASALSQAVAATAAVTQDIPLYQHIAACRYGEVPEKLSLPLPMVTMLMSGKGAPGKLNCIKEIMIVPRHDMPYSESLKHIINIYNYCLKNITAKTGLMGRVVNDQGALWASFDRPEQALDLVQEAMTLLELTPGEHFNIAINCAGHEIFDYEKGKYEVMAGLMKSADDLVEFWSDIINRYPAVIALIDPMRKQEKEAWMRLCESVSEKCYIVGDYVHHRPGLLKDEEFSQDFRSSATVVRLERMNTVTDIIRAARKLQEAESRLVIGTSLGETTDTFLVDLAIGCGAHFIRLGAPCRGERVSKLNHLLQVEAHLADSGKHLPSPAVTFPIIKPPTPPPEVTEGDVATPTSRQSPHSRKS